MDAQPELQQCLRDLRQTAAAIGAEAARLLPDNPGTPVAETNMAPVT